MELLCAAFALNAGYNALQSAISYQETLNRLITSMSHSVLLVAVDVVHRSTPAFLHVGRRLRVAYLVAGSGE